MSQIHGEGCPKPWDTPRDVPNPWDTPRDVPWFWASLLRKNAPKWQKNALHRFHTHCTRTPHTHAAQAHARRMCTPNARARRTHAARHMGMPKKSKTKGLKLSNFLIRDAQILGKPLGVSHGFGTSLGVSQGFGHPC